jgi:ribosomal protein S6--L-glutamate ligase
VRYPELDLRQRLTVTRGYGVAELTVGEELGLAHQSIADTGLRGRDITVLSLTRDGKVIPNPKATRELQIGDRLLCYGKIASMNELLPAKLRERVRRHTTPKDLETSD